MRWLTLLTLPLLFASLIRADDEKNEQIAKQKAKALDILKKCDVDKPGLIETQDLIVCGALPDDKLKTMGDAVQKRYTAMLKALRFEDGDNPPKGKLAIYFFPERKKFTFFVNEVVGQKPEKDDRSHADGRADAPYVVVSVLPGEKPTDLEAEASLQAAVALFQAKVGPTELPTWMTGGFQRAVKMRNDPRAATADRAAIKGLVVGVQGMTSKWKANDAWMGEGDPREKALLAASLMEYLVFGPEAAKFSKILAGFRGAEGDAAAKIDAALKAADFTIPKLDTAWKKWVATGK